MEGRPESIRPVCMTNSTGSWLKWTVNMSRKNIERFSSPENRKICGTQTRVHRPREFSSNQDSNLWKRPPCQARIPLTTWAGSTPVSRSSNPWWLYTKSR